MLDLNPIVVWFKNLTSGIKISSIFSNLFFYNRSSSNVWGYFSLNASGGVHEYADSQFGHIFSYGSSRDAARKNLVVALKELSIRGDFRTTVEYLIKLLETDMYIDNTVR